MRYRFSDFLLDRLLDEVLLAHRARVLEPAEAVLSVDVVLRRDSREEVRKRLMVPNVRISSGVILDCSTDDLRRPNGRSKKFRLPDFFDFRDSWPRDC